ncbi:MAG: NUDIX domain-containing protein [Patescibacteria group bacterium]|nr:NUDIX domain-containing protein [Patescibacteria group bacterium]
MEYFDVLDESGNFTGKKATREEVHRKGLWHRVAHIWIVNSKGEVLIQKRASDKDSYPNMWAMSCEGHVSAGQEPMQGALRELKEELGIDLKLDQIELSFTYKRSARYSRNFIGNHFIDVYVLRKDINTSKLVIQKEEISDIRWIKLDDYLGAIKNNDPDFRDYPDELDRVSEILKKIR